MNNDDSPINQLADALNKALGTVEADIAQAKAIAQEIKLARDAVAIFSIEASAIPTLTIDTQIPLKDANLFLAAQSRDEQLIYASNTSSTTVSTLSSFIASIPADHVGCQFVDTRKFLTDHDFPIQTIHDAMCKLLLRYGTHLPKMLEGARSTLGDLTNPLRAASTSTLLRELMRELLAIIAPDAALKLAKWFVPHDSSDTGVTRRHRLTFAVYQYVIPSEYPSTFVEIADGQIDSLLTTVRAFSKDTHATADTMSAALQREDELYRLFLLQLSEVFPTIEKARDILKDNLETILAEHLSDLFDNHTFPELDELSTHTRPEAADDVSVEITNITPDSIAFSGQGSVSCDLQKGSDGDCKRGDGLELSASFPFTFSGTASTKQLSDIHISPNDIHVDTGTSHE